jgi:oligopeptide transport system permease protein
MSPATGLWSRAWKQLRHDPMALAGGVFILTMAAVALFGPYIAPHSYWEQDLANVLSPPSSIYKLGTDALGRDILSRLLWGTRISMTVAIVTSMVALFFGTAYGSISGYIGHRIDTVLMRIVDVIYGFPDLLLIILLTVVMGRGMMAVVVALSLVSWVSVARLIRGEVLRLKEQDFVLAANALGAGHASIIIRHILPNTIGPLLVTLTFRIPSVILAESTLSFIGLGVEPPRPSWGNLANDGWVLIRFSPHVIIFPTIAITLTMLAFNYLGDGLRDAFDPKRVN